MEYIELTEEHCSGESLDMRYVSKAFHLNLYFKKNNVLKDFILESMKNNSKSLSFVCNFILYEWAG